MFPVMVVLILSRATTKYLMHLTDTPSIKHTFSIHNTFSSIKRHPELQASWTSGHRATASMVLRLSPGLSDTFLLY